MIENQRYAILKSILDARDISQADIADAIGMDRTTFNVKINRYKGRDFTLQEAIKISNFIGVSIDDFF
ncbi:helix-turn-helix domain-containing protein [Peptostreptococcus stomatis]